jgi:SEC-C motif-containing protein
MAECPCGSGRDYENCCAPYISKKAAAPTAEILMRARYSAYALGAIDFIVDTCVRDDDHGIDIEATKRWSEKSTWIGLKILRSEKGGASDSEGKVEFTATFVKDGLREEHHEISNFVRKDGAWLFEEGEVVPTTIVREGAKVGRNEMCPCGSGKKYKKCCGAGA